LAEKKYVQTEIVIPEEYNHETRVAIAQDILEEIRERAKRGVGIDSSKREKTFPAYSKAYTQSLDYKNAKGTSKTVNLTLSGDMLAELDLVKDTKGKLVIGFDPGSDAAGRAEGNIRGSYGDSRGSKAKARNFLGLPKEVITGILKKYPIKDRQKTDENVSKSKAKQQAAKKVARKDIDADF